MQRLYFIDDDKDELKAFQKIIRGHYHYTSFHWPKDSVKLFRSPAPSIFVSDLYLPSKEKGDTAPKEEDIATAARYARRVGNLFHRLYADAFTAEKGPLQETTIKAKARLQETMKAIIKAYKLLDRQWKALGQHPDHGVALLRELKARYPQVPVVFYSRKITPEDVIRVLQAGATDAIRKGARRNVVLARMARAEQIYSPPRFNVNVTLLRSSGKKAAGTGRKRGHRR